MDERYWQVHQHDTPNGGIEWEMVEHGPDGHHVSLWRTADWDEAVGILLPRTQAELGFSDDEVSAHIDIVELM